MTLQKRILWCAQCILAAAIASCSANEPSSTISNKAQSTESKGISLNIYGNWCGPNHPIRKQGITDPASVDYVDNACRTHDICYERKGYFNCDCDIELLWNISQVESSIRKARASPHSASLYGAESIASAATQIYYSLPLCVGGNFALKAATSPFLAYRTGAGIVGGAAAEILTLPLKGIWWLACPFSEQGCGNPP